MKVNSFNPVASDYSKKVAPYRYAQFLTLVHELDLFGDEQVLDIGSGPGELSMEIAKQLASGGFLRGIDLSPQMIRLARRIARQQRRNNVAFASGDALKLAFEADSFDVVVSSNAFPWVPDRPRFLSEVFRVLKPGGRFGLVALSDRCYREFAAAFKRVASQHPDLFPAGRPFEQMGAMLHTSRALGRQVEEAGFEVVKRFTVSTEEPTSPDAYVERVNAIVHENYLDHLRGKAQRARARRLLIEALARRNGDLSLTESSAFVIAKKPGWGLDFVI
jgi:ubiquinone/menaquinone biosynthesis C-methylase UbiE